VNGSVHFTLKVKAARSSETSLSYRNSTRLHNSEERDLNLHHRENLEFRE